jgi:hypothetical protein
MDGGKVFAAPTSKVGTWVHLSFYPNHSVEALRVSNESSIWVTWNPDTCVPSIKPTLNPSDSQSANVIRDSDLQKIADEKGSALIYEWSPNMTLSVRGFPEAQELAKKLGIGFVPVLDPNADTVFAKETASKNAIPEAALRRDGTLELAMRGMHLHFPTSIVISKGVVSPLYPGYWVDLPAYERFIRANLK